MKADLFAALDVYATGMQWATWIWIGSALLLTVFFAVAAVLIGRNILDVFARAIGLTNDIQQPREGETL
ncbi:hypothetical protein ACIRLA_22260 [Streptomyces sp. NPDC102364]|uniref:hypothetical protein n=1 Tax=Streptomyces sp. NPDC102364 TaxID=3366161 RepID=UPI003824E3FC